MQKTKALSRQAVVLSRSEIVQLLDQYGVPWKSWGTATSRTLDDLVHSHHRDQFFFNLDTPGRCIVEMHTAVVFVYYRRRGKWIEIVEDRQEFANGSILKRGFVGIGETARRRESLKSAAHRCLKEELSFRDTSQYKLSDCFGIINQPMIESEKWPGLWAIYNRHNFECTISRNLFHPDGYVEKGKGRKVYFTWQAKKQLEFDLQ